MRPSRTGVALNPTTGSLSDAEGERHGHRGEATWRQRWRREGGGHQPRDGHLEPPEAGRGGEDPPLEPLQGAQPRDGRLEPPEAGRGGEDPPLEPLQGAQPWDTLTTDVWSLGPEGGWMFVVLIPQSVVICYSCTQDN